MRFQIAMRRKNKNPLRNVAGALLLSSAIAGFSANVSLAETHHDLSPRNKTSLLSLYQDWAADKTDSTDTKNITIEPASSPARSPVSSKIRKQLPKIKSAAKKPSSSDITDEEILAQSDAEANDPFEPVNRLVFGFNEILDHAILTPVAKTYRFIVPGPVRTGVSNAVANAKAPVTFANDLLQGKPERAKTTFMRFLINSTVGMGGFVDAAEAGGFEKHTEDFGQTLAVWGVGSGPYLVIPVFGPSSPRHVVGRVVDTAATPTTWILADHSLFERSTPTIADLVTGREALLGDVAALRESSPDFYASVRDIYRQGRKNAIFDGDLEVDPIPDLPIE